MKIDTLVVKGIESHDNPHKAVIPPIYLASTYIQDELGNFREYAYQRGGNPTRAAFEKLFAQVEGSKYAYAFASGMAATTAVFNLLKTGDKVLLNNNVYGGTYRYVSGIFQNQGISYEMVDDFNALTEADLDDKVRFIFIETPSNPLLRVTDLERVVRLAHSKGIKVIADNTFMTPYCQKCLNFGVDIVVYSATKYIGGHADVLAGLVATNDDAVAERIKFIQKTLGAMLSPFDTYSLIRGIKTLSVRMDRQMDNTHAIIDFLESHEGVKTVHYAGSHSREEKAVHSKQAKDIGAVISIELADGYDETAFVKGLKFFDLAVSMGGVESLICQPAFMTHESYPAQLRAQIGINDGLLRLAVGIENKDDLIADLAGALKGAKK